MWVSMKRFLSNKKRPPWQNYCMGCGSKDKNSTGRTRIKSGWTCSKKPGLQDQILYASRKDSIYLLTPRCLK